MSMPENIENTEELVNTIKGQIADKEKRNTGEFYKTWRSILCKIRKKSRWRFF